MTEIDGWHSDDDSDGDTSFASASSGESPSKGIEMSTPEKSITSPPSDVSISKSGDVSPPVAQGEDTPQRPPLIKGQAFELSPTSTILPISILEHSPRASPTDKNSPVTSAVDNDSPFTSPVSKDSPVISPVDKDISMSPSDTNSPMTSPKDKNSPLTSPLDKNSPVSSPVDKNSLLPSPTDTNSLSPQQHTFSKHSNSGRPAMNQQSPFMRRLKATPSISPSAPANTPVGSPTILKRMMTAIRRRSETQFTEGGYGSKSQHRPMQRSVSSPEFLGKG